MGGGEGRCAAVYVVIFLGELGRGRLAVEGWADKVVQMWYV